MNLKSTVAGIEAGFNARLARAALLEQTAVTQVRTAAASWPVRIVFIATLIAGFALGQLF